MTTELQCNSRNRRNRNTPLVSNHELADLASPDKQATMVGWRESGHYQSSSMLAANALASLYIIPAVTPESSLLAQTKQ